MTKRAVALATLGFLMLATLLAALPAVIAHGVEPAREVDTRIKEDDDGRFGPGGCAADAAAACNNAGNIHGLDLLSLDARETHLANGTAAVDFRFGVQLGGTGVTQTVTLTLKAGGAARTFSFSGPTGNYTSTTCTKLEGPVDFPGGDGDSKAVDCYVTYAALGVNGTGAALTDIVVVSSVGTDKYDQIPGTWYAKGATTLTPRVPDACTTPTSPTSCEQPKASDASGGDAVKGTYTLTGPANLLNASLSATRADLKAGPVKLKVMLGNPLNKTDQVVTLNLTAPNTIQASLDAGTVSLRNGTQGMVTLNIVGATKDGTVTILVTSDLGARHLLTLSVVAPPPAPVCPPQAANSTATSTTTGCPSGTTTTTTKASGAPESLFVGSLLLVLALSRRRKA